MATSLVGRTSRAGAMPMPNRGTFRAARMQMRNVPLRKLGPGHIAPNLRLKPAGSALEGRAGQAFVSNLDTALPDSLQLEQAAVTTQQLLESEAISSTTSASSIDASWEHWLQYINSLEESEEMLETLQHRMALAAQEERYADAAALKKEVELLQHEDVVHAVRQELQQAVEAEQYSQAAHLRDRGMAALEGWWCGRAEGDLHGHILHITAGFGRWVAKLYTPRELAELKGWRDESSNRLFEQSELSLDKMGTPLFEVFVRRGDADALTHQPVALRHREGAEGGALHRGPLGGSDETMLVGRLAVSVVDEDVDKDVFGGLGGEEGGEEVVVGLAGVGLAPPKVVPEGVPVEGGEEGAQEGVVQEGSGASTGHMGSHVMQYARALAEGVPVADSTEVKSQLTEREQQEVAETLAALADLPLTPPAKAGGVEGQGEGQGQGQGSDGVLHQRGGIVSSSGAAEGGEEGEGGVGRVHRRPWQAQQHGGLTDAERLEALLAATSSDILEDDVGWKGGSGMGGTESGSGAAEESGFASPWLRMPAMIMPLGRDKFAFRVQDGPDGGAEGGVGGGLGALGGLLGGSAPRRADTEVHVEEAGEGKVEVVLAMRGQDVTAQSMEDAVRKIAEAVVQLQDLRSGTALPRHQVTAAIRKVTEQLLEQGATPWTPRPADAPAEDDTVAPSSNPVLTYTRIPTVHPRTDPYTGLFLGAFGAHGPELLRLERRVEEDGEEYVVGVKLTGDLHVPAGAVSFKAKIGRKHRLDSREVYPEELGVLARYRGEGRIASPGFKNAKWVEGELLQLASTPLTGGAEMGFVWAVPGEKRFLILLNRIELD